MDAIQSKKVYEELGLKSLKSRRWCKRLSSMFKIMKGKAPNYLKNLIQINQSVRTNKNKPCTNIPLQNRLFQKFFFSFYLKRLVQLRCCHKKLWVDYSFKSRLLLFIRPVPSNVYDIFDPMGLKLLTHLRLGFSHLNGHRFRHNFQTCMNPLCSCSLEIENKLHYLLQAHHFSQSRIDLRNSV